MIYDPIVEVVKPGIQAVNQRLTLNEQLFKIQLAFFDYYFGGNLPDRRRLDHAVCELKSLSVQLKNLDRHRSVDFGALMSVGSRIMANQENLANLQKMREWLVSSYPCPDLATPMLYAVNLLVISHRQTSRHATCLPFSHLWLDHDSPSLRCHAIRVYKAAGGSVELSSILASLAPLFRREDKPEADYEYRMRTEEEQEEELVQSFTGPSVHGQEVKIWNLLMNPVELPRAYAEFVDELLAHAVHFENSDEGLRRLLLTKINSQEPEGSQDFYEGSAAKFTAPLFEALSVIRAKIAELLELYPEHDVLLSLDSMAQRIVDLPKDSPLAAFCHSVEMWLGKSEDWQNYCSQSNLLPIEGLTALIVEWRKMELMQWRELYERLEQKTGEDTKRHWPWLFEACRLEACEFASILDSFLLGTTVGELSGRLALLEKLADYVSTDKRQIIQTIMAYFARLQQQATDLVAQLKPAIDEDLKAFAVGMHWNDKTIFGLRQNVEKSRRKLGQFLRKYKEILDTPVIHLKGRMERERVAQINSTCLPGHLANELIQLDTEMIERLAELRAMNSDDHLTVKQNSLLELFRTLKTMGFNLNRMLDSPRRVDLLIRPETKNIIPLVHHWNEFSLALHTPHEDLSPVHLKAMEAVVLQSLDFGLRLSRQLSSWEDLNDQRVKAGSSEVLISGLDTLRVMLQEIPLMAYTQELHAEVLRLQALLPQFTEASYLGPEVEYLADVIDPLKKVLASTRPIIKQVQRVQFSVLSQVGFQETRNLEGLLYFEGGPAIPYSNLPFICEEMQALLKAWCSVSCLVASIFTGLLREGFCRPATANKSKEEGDQTEDGMGMADAPSAQDAKNVSGEIEFEEQVTDLQTDAEKTKEAGSEREEEGLEMPNDFEAAMEELLNEDSQDQEDDRPEEMGGSKGDDAKPSVEPVNEDWLEQEEAEGTEEQVGEQEHAGEKNKTEFGVAHTSDDDDDDDAGVGSAEENVCQDQLDESVSVSGSEDVGDDDDVEDGADEEMEGEEMEGEEMEGEEMAGEESAGDDDSDEELTETPVASEQEYGRNEKGEQEGEEEMGLEAGGMGDDEVRAEVAPTTEKTDERSTAKPLEEAVKDAQQTVHEILETMTQRPTDAVDKARLTADQLYQTTTDLDAMAVNADYEEATGASGTSVEPKRGEPRQNQPLAEQQVNEDLSRLKLSAPLERPTVEADTKESILEPISLRPWDAVLMDTAPAAFELAEQLRLILTPTRATKLRGDYRTGKRLNMRKIIQYVASQYRKDKIWLRRTKPSQRQYRICLSVDNSRSMRNGGSTSLAVDSIAIISQALGRLEAGEMAVISFGRESQVILPFTAQINASQGADLCQRLTFADESTDMPGMLTLAQSLLSSDGGDTWRLNLIVSDGIFQDFDRIAALNNACLEERIINVFVIVDGQSKILEMSQVEYVKGESGETKVRMTKYLEKFPFEFYVVVKHLEQLPAVLSDALRQWFEVLESA